MQCGTRAGHRPTTGGDHARGSPSSSKTAKRIEPNPDEPGSDPAPVKQSRDVKSPAADLAPASAYTTVSPRDAGIHVIPAQQEQARLEPARLPWYHLQVAHFPRNQFEREENRPQSCSHASGFHAKLPLSSSIDDRYRLPDDVLVEGGQSYVTHVDEPLPIRFQILKVVKDDSTDTKTPMVSCNPVWVQRLGGYPEENPFKMSPLQTSLGSSRRRRRH